MSRFHWSYEGGRELLNAPFMVAEMRKRAEAGKAFAEATAPVDENGPHPGRFKASFSVSSGVGGGKDHDRAYGKLTNDDPAALWIELGTKDTPRHRTLGKALDIMGGG